MRAIPTLLASFGFAVVAAVAGYAAQSSGGARPGACSLLTKAEVKKHLPWNNALDQFPVEEEPLGTYGSSCDYPSVTVQVLAFVQSTIDAQKKKGQLETISGVGDEAYFRNNANQYGELYVKSGKFLLTLQANAVGKVDAVKPGTISLAKAMLPKLR